MANVAYATILKQVQDGRVFESDDHLYKHANMTIRGAIIDFVVREQKRAAVEVPDSGKIPESDIWEILPDDFFATDEEKQIVFLRLQNYFDREIAEQIGHTREYVTALRRKIGQRYVERQLGTEVYRSSQKSSSSRSGPDSNGRETGPS